jgi:hypothetical protein
VPELNPSAISSSPGTPYVTPQMLLAAPTGIVWSTIGPGARPNEAEQFNEQLNLCRRASSMIDGYCNQPLRATLDQETLYGPGDLRFQMQSNGNARLLLSRSPVTFVAGGLVSTAASFPAQWTPVPATAFRPATPLIGVFGSTVPSGSDNSGQAVYLQPGYVSWLAGRGGYVVQVAYVNGWPHASLQAPASKGDMTIAVDDCTGWVQPPGTGTSAITAAMSGMTLAVPPPPAGATATMYDPLYQEVISVGAASAAAGPGTLALTSPLAYSHAVGVMVSTLPQSVIQAAILFCVAQALTRGATATTAPGGGGGGGAGSVDHAGEAELLCHPYRRVI